MKLRKSQSNEYYPLILPEGSKDLIDWRATAQAVLQDENAFNLAKKVLESEIQESLPVDAPKVELPKDEVIKRYQDFCDKNHNHLITRYVSSNFDVDFFKWKEGQVPSYLLFKPIFDTDLIRLKKNDKIRKYLDSQLKSKEKEKDKEKNSADVDVVEGSILYIQEVFKDKLVGVQYDGDIPESERFTREDVLEVINGDGLEMPDSQLFSIFSQALMNGAIAKKKTLQSSVE